MIQNSKQSYKTNPSFRARYFFPILISFCSLSLNLTSGSVFASIMRYEKILTSSNDEIDLIRETIKQKTWTEDILPEPRDSNGTIYRAQLPNAIKSFYFTLLLLSDYSALIVSTGAGFEALKNQEMIRWIDTDKGLERAKGSFNGTLLDFSNGLTILRKLTWQMYQSAPHLTSEIFRSDFITAVKTSKELIEEKYGNNQINRLSYNVTDYEQHFRGIWFDFWMKLWSEFNSTQDELGELKVDRELLQSFGENSEEDSLFGHFYNNILLQIESPEETSPPVLPADPSSQGASCLVL